MKDTYFQCIYGYDSFLGHQKLSGKTIIYSDCKSAISIHKGRNHNPDISISHVPAHVGIVGNEAADWLAKQGTKPGNINWEKFWNDLDDNFR